MRKMLLAIPAIFTTLLSAPVNSLDMEFLGAEANQTSTGYVDSHIEMLRKDGRDPDVRSVFEEMRLALDEAEERGESLDDSEHPLLGARNEGVDISLNMVWDYNHVISLKLNDGSK
mmetsp:Transcript_1595/g.2355  ORF Transcript_1595/g.2355 Transcript_1595/m.2355 type:complete len:116 (-) Transcript_1595:1492-1839(-)